MRVYTITLLLAGTVVVPTPIGADAQDRQTLPSPDDVYYAVAGRAGTASTMPDGVAAEVLALEREIEAAVVRGDVTFVDAATAPTFTFTHGDGWTTGGAPLRVDSRADWMATVARAPYASRVFGV